MDGQDPTPLASEQHKKKLFFFRVYRAMGIVLPGYIVIKISH